MMMPEQKQLLDEMWEKQEWKEKPILSDFQIEEINILLQLALKDDLTIEIEYFHNHDFNKISGKLLGVDVLNQFVSIEEKNIPLDNITGAWID